MKSRLDKDKFLHELNDTIDDTCFWGDGQSVMQRYLLHFNLYLIIKVEILNDVDITQSKLDEILLHRSE